MQHKIQIQRFLYMHPKVKGFSGKTEKINLPKRKRVINICWLCRQIFRNISLYWDGR